MKAALLALLLSPNPQAVAQVRPVAGTGQAARLPFPAISEAQAGRVLTVLNTSEVFDGGFRPLLEWLRQASLSRPETCKRLEPFAEQLADAEPQARSLPAERLEALLAEASAEAASRWRTLPPAAGAENPDALDASADAIDLYGEQFGGYFAAHELRSLRREAGSARSRASALREASRTAEALGSLADPGAVEGAQESRADASGLAPSREQARELPEAPPAPALSPSRFNAATVGSYLGAGLVLVAMAWFAFNVGTLMGAGAVTLVLAGYGAAFLWLGSSLKKRGQDVPAGLLASLAVFVVPLAMGSFFEAAGLWERIGTHGMHAFTMAMELSTISAAILAARRFRFAFIALPGALAALVFVLDAGTLLTDRFNWYFESLSWISAAGGAAMLAVSRLLDRASRSPDYGFWTHLAGLAAFWGGLATIPAHGELGRALFALVNLGLVALSLRFDRRAYAVFGATGFFWYIGHLLWEVLGKSLLLPFALAGVGISMILGFAWYHRNYERLKAWLDRLLPRRAKGPDGA